MMEKRRQGTAEFPMHPGIDEAREIAAEKCVDLRERLRQREAELEQAVSALREVHDGHTRSLSSGTGKITVCTCRICSVLPSPPKEAKS